MDLFFHYNLELEWISLQDNWCPWITPRKGIDRHPDTLYRIGCYQVSPQYTVLYLSDTISFVSPQ